MLSYCICSENQRDTKGKWRNYSRTQCIRSNSQHAVNCDAGQTLNRSASCGSVSILIVLLYVVSVCLRPCDGGVNCSGYSISCDHGTCIEDRSSKKGGNQTVNVVCLCDDRWSGPACDVFTCKGRTL